jgi:hypothetical protein
MTFTSLEALREQVTDNGDVATVSMRQVRDAYGAGRLGRHVRMNISRALQSQGLGHYPPELPDDQGQYIRVYRLGSPAAVFIDAVLNPNPDHDETIREAAGGEAAEILEQIKELVC